MHAMPDLIAERARIAASAARLRPDLPPDRVQERHMAWRHALMQERLVRALVARYPVTALMLGGPLFPGTARAFALEHPPRTPVLGEWGDAFPGFLAGFRPTEDVAFLPDVARIERAVWRALHAPDAPPMSHADLSVAALAQPDLLFLRLHPALGTVGSRHPALSIWSRRVFGELADATVAWSPESLFVTRIGDRVHLERITKAEMAFLDALRSEACLAEARAAGAAVAPGFGSARLLDRLLALGQITGAC